MSIDPERKLAAHVQAAIAAGRGLGVGQAKVGGQRGGRGMAAHVQAAIAVGRGVGVGQAKMGGQGGGRGMAAHLPVQRMMVPPEEPPEPPPEEPPEPPPEEPSERETVAVLFQKNNPSHRCTTLFPWETAFNTGYMTECVSVVVLFGMKNGVYSQGRGYHGGGGPGNVNYDSLMSHIPNPKDALIITVTGISRGPEDSDDADEIEDRIDAEATDYGLIGTRQEFYHSCNRALIFNTGKVVTE